MVLRFDVDTVTRYLKFIKGDSSVKALKLHESDTSNSFFVFCESDKEEQHWEIVTHGDLYFIMLRVEKIEKLKKLIYGKNGMVDNREWLR
jgi:hypothetical protein